MIAFYNSRLDERVRRRTFLYSRGLLDTRKIQARGPSFAFLLAHALASFQPSCADPPFPPIHASRVFLAATVLQAKEKHIPPSEAPLRAKLRVFARFQARPSSLFTLDYEGVPLRAAVLL